MAPKKGKKISLNEFLGDNTLGSWADEMDSLPSAPAGRNDEDQSRPGDRYGRRDDMLPRSDRMQSVREDIPLPTQPPYTAYVGNLAFDLTELDLEQFFAGSTIKSVKIIKDREEKPKGFGYVEFEGLDGLKDAIAKTGSSLSGRTVRISVAEPPKERSGFGGSADDSKFDNPWRRDGPLPDLPSRDSSRRRFDSHLGERPASGPTEGVDDWRSSRPPRATEQDTPSFKRKGSGFLPPDAQANHADKDEVWSIGSKFKPSATSDEPSGRFGSLRGKPEASPKESSELDNDWRSSARPRPTGRGNISPSASTPPTPQLGRKKLELLPRSGAGSVSPSPLSSPKIASTPSVPNPSRTNPFGAARPVDVSQKEKEVLEKLERDREVNKERFAMSRTNSRTASERGGPRARSPPATSSPVVPSRALAPNVRPTLSFANVAAKKELLDKKEQVEDEQDIKEVADKTADLVV